MEKFFHLQFSFHRKKGDVVHRTIKFMIDWFPTLPKTKYIPDVVLFVIVLLFKLCVRTKLTMDARDSVSKMTVILGSEFENQDNTLQFLIGTRL